MRHEINDSIEILKEQINILDPGVIISFGVPAHNSLKDLGISHVPFYHPARYYYHKTEKIEE